MDNRASKYLSFDALKGLKETIIETDLYTTKEKYPNISSEQKEDMDIILYQSFLRKEVIKIRYYDKNGIINDIEDCVLKIDLYNHRIKLLVHRPIYLAQIVLLSRIEK